MPADTAAGRVAHEAGFFGSDDELRAMIVPFVEDGVAAGEPVFVSYDDRKTALMRSWIADTSGVTFGADPDLYATPARAIASYTKEIEDSVAAGANRVRLTGELPVQGRGAHLAGWDRYEAAVNTVWNGFPVYSRCLYDATTTTPQMRDAVERTHPHLLTASGECHANDRYEGGPDFRRSPAGPDPLERSAPLVDLADPSPAQAREAVARAVRGHVDDTALEDFELGASEAVANATLHGLGPTDLRVWAGQGRALVQVRDSGPGATDHLAGLVPASSNPAGAGMGLWVTHQLGLYVDLLREPDGFTVRLRSPLPHG
jgi:anti-sigma regulatory factor (Ser/Thr protein kinase)